jgi:predicted Zn-dependent protease
MQAMADELERSINTLQMENLGKPYFIGYRVDDFQEAKSSATFGAMQESDTTHRRYLTVELRVGDYSLDNTNFVTRPTFTFSLRPRGPAQLPLDDTYQETRREIWLTTDTAYKQAVDHLAKKRAALQNKTRTDEIADFSRVEPSTSVSKDPLPELPDIRQADEMLQNLSRLFRSMPEIHSSTVRLSAQVVHTRYLNSEGTSYTRAQPTASLVATATTQAADGMPLNDFVAVYARSPAELPDEEVLSVQIKRMGERLVALRQAPLPETYNGPVLFEGQAAAELLAQVFVPRLLASRKPVSDSPQMEMYLARSAGSSFIDKIGARVLPRFMEVVDNPILQEHAQQPLLGGYAVDDEGVPAAETVLVRRGLLKTLLTTRTPVRGITDSTGNRRGDGAAPSNLVFSGSGGLTDEELRQELIELVKERELEYGVIVRRIANPILVVNGSRRGEGVQPVIAAYRLYTDGREELIRNLLVSDLDAGAFKEIIAISEQQTVTTIPFRPTSSAMSWLSMGGRPAGGPPLISLVTPSLLFEDMTLKKPSGEIPKPPFAKHPFFAE